MRQDLAIPIIKISILTGMIFLLSVQTFGQSNSPKLEDWNFRISPYFWFVSFNGTIYRPPYPATLPEPQQKEYDYDISFKEVAPHLKFAFMAAGEYRYNRFVTQFNLASFIIDGDAITPLDYVFQNISLHLGYLSGDLSAGHHFIMNDKFELAAIGGLKYVHFNIKGSTSLVGTVDLAGERNFLWMDPIFGFRLKYIPFKRLEIATYSDVGGFIFGYELNYQFIGTVNYLVSKWFLVTLGYRYWGLDVNKSDAIYNGTISGAILRLGFQF